MPTTDRGRARSRRPGSGFSLIETMVVVTILAIIAALGTPAILPLLYATQIEAAAEAVASLAAEARLDAMSLRRCTRLQVVNETGPAIVKIYRLNIFDCIDNPADPNLVRRETGQAPATNNLWVELGQIQLDDAQVRIDFLDGATDMSAPVFAGAHGSWKAAPWDKPAVVWRSTGRLYTDEQWTAAANMYNDDDAALVVSHNNLPFTAENKIYVVFESHGPICVKPRGTALAPGNNWSCP